MFNLFKSFQSKKKRCIVQQVYNEDGLLLRKKKNNIVLNISRDKKGHLHKAIIEMFNDPLCDLETKKQILTNLTSLKELPFKLTDKMVLSISYQSQQVVQKKEQNVLLRQVQLS